MSVSWRHTPDPTPNLNLNTNLNLTDPFEVLQLNTVFSPATSTMATQLTLSLPPIQALTAPTLPAPGTPARVGSGMTCGHYRRCPQGPTSALAPAPSRSTSPGPSGPPAPRSGLQARLDCVLVPHGVLAAPWRSGSPMLVWKPAPAPAAQPHLVGYNR